LQELLGIRDAPVAEAVAAPAVSMMSVLVHIHSPPFS
jgi:hypothetical protein